MRRDRRDARRAPRRRRAADGGADGAAETRVAVTVDLSGLTGAGITEVVVMNEQGARCFDRYEDSDGAVLRGDGIGTWDEVGAARASLVSTGHRVAFSLGAGAGRETVSWARARRLAPRLGGLRLLAPAHARLVRLRAHHREDAVTSVLHRLSVHPPVDRPLAVPLPPAGAGLRRRRSARGGPRRAAPGLHLPAPRRGAAHGAGGERRGRRHLLHGDDARRLSLVRRAPARPLPPARRRRPAADVRARDVPRALRRGRARRGRGDHGRAPRRARVGRGPRRGARAS